MLLQLNNADNPAKAEVHAHPPRVPVSLGIVNVLGRGVALEVVAPETPLKNTAVKITISAPVTTLIADAIMYALPVARMTTKLRNVPSVMTTSTVDINVASVPS